MEVSLNVQYLKVASTGECGFIVNSNNFVCLRCMDFPCEVAGCELKTRKFSEKVSLIVFR